MITVSTEMAGASKDSGMMGTFLRMFSKVDCKIAAELYPNAWSHCETAGSCSTLVDA
jgi:hypothetical protein